MVTDPQWQTLDLGGRPRGRTRVADPVVEQKKLNRAQKERASNIAQIAPLYGANSTSIMLNRLGVDQECDCDRQTHGRTNGLLHSIEIRVFTKAI